MAKKDTIETNDDNGMQEIISKPGANGDFGALKLFNAATSPDSVKEMVSGFKTKYKHNQN